MRASVRCQSWPIRCLLKSTSQPRSQTKSRRRYPQPLSTRCSTSSPVSHCWSVTFEPWTAELWPSCLTAVDDEETEAVTTDQPSINEGELFELKKLERQMFLDKYSKSDVSLIPPPSSVNRVGFAAISYPGSKGKSHVSKMGFIR